MLTDWWNGMTLIQQILAAFALPATAILLIQTVLLLFGIGGHQDADAGGLVAEHGMDHADSLPLPDQTDLDMADEPADFHADTGLRLITVRGLVAFFAIGGWVGIAMIDLGMQAVAASLIALVSGLAGLTLVALIFRGFMQLQSSGNINLNRAKGAIGEVYLRIPGDLQGAGKISLVLQDRLVEADAMTDQPEAIITGSQIQVIRMQGDRLIVRAIKQDKPNQEKPLG